MSITLGQLAAELGATRATVNAAVRPIVARAAVQTKDRMRQEASGHRHAPALPSSITYDLKQGGLAFECGPVTGAAGSLAFYYFGNSKVNASVPDPVIILNDEAEKAAGFMAAAVAGVLLK